MTATNTNKLTAALAKAQAACQAVAKDAKNEHHGYRYVTAEAIITEARAALAFAGLVLVPTVSALKGDKIVRRFRLVDLESGESMNLTSIWPVVPGNGRPMDKAVAAADTVSLAYLLRDLLLLPRVEAGTDVAGRDDTRYKHSAQPQGLKADKPAASAPTISEVQRMELVRLIKGSGANVVKLLAYFHVPVLQKLPAGLFPKAKAMLERKIAEGHGMPTPVNRINGTRRMAS